ncbi:hypothetical protein M2317_002199 [Microbacterium sp. ZKA21]|uniref:hypothetical protein n=1 Tax=Microbacterium sp. ZKA21 TaxID=3381694 RepID=UPI003D22E0AF
MNEQHLANLLARMTPDQRAAILPTLSAEVVARVVDPEKLLAALTSTTATLTQDQATLIDAWCDGHMIVPGEIVTDDLPALTGIIDEILLLTDDPDPVSQVRTAILLRQATAHLTWGAVTQNRLTGVQGDYYGPSWDQVARLNASDRADLVEIMGNLGRLPRTGAKAVA